MDHNPRIINELKAQTPAQKDVLWKVMAAISCFL